jgi:hypothetical protein
MSRIATPTSQPASQVKIPTEKIAMRAYEKWVKRGRTHGSDLQDWVEAENELRAELAKTGSHSTFGTQHAAQTRR